MTNEELKQIALRIVTRLDQQHSAALRDQVLLQGMVAGINLLISEVEQAENVNVGQSDTSST